MNFILYVLNNIRRNLTGTINSFYILRTDRLSQL